LSKISRAHYFSLWEYKRAQVWNRQIKRHNVVYSSSVFSYRESIRQSICNRLEDQTAAVGLHVRKSALVVQVSEKKWVIYLHLCLQNTHVLGQPFKIMCQGKYFLSSISEN